MNALVSAALWSAGLAFCERKRAFYIMDPPPGVAADDSFSTMGLPKIQDRLDTGRSGASIPTFAAIVDLPLQTGCREPAQRCQPLGERDGR